VKALEAFVAAVGKLDPTMVVMVMLVMQTKIRVPVPAPVSL
jgi:hypothetical protein